MIKFEAARTPSATDVFVTVGVVVACSLISPLHRSPLLTAILLEYPAETSEENRLWYPIANWFSEALFPSLLLFSYVYFFLSNSGDRREK